MDYETMRLECLKLATAQGYKGEEAIKVAERMMDFAKCGYTCERGVPDRAAEAKKFTDYALMDFAKCGYTCERGVPDRVRLAGL